MGLFSGEAMETKMKIQYACAVLLIISSICLAYISDFCHGDIPAGTLMYIAQAFLLAGSVFGLDAYIKMASQKLGK